MNSKSRHGYSKLLSFQFFNQIQYKYYRNNSLMYKEGISFDHSQCQDDNTSENLTFKYIIKYYPFYFVRLMTHYNSENPEHVDSGNNSEQSSSQNIPTQLKSKKPCGIE